MPLTRFRATLGAALAALAALSVVVGCSTDALPSAALGGRPAVHRVRMVLDTVALTYRFVPADLVIRRGDVVEFVNESGGPHNVAFERDEFTPEAAAALDRAMPDHAGAMEKMGLLVGPLITREGLMYDVSFAAVAPGTYHFHCTPHEALGMTGTITVQ